MNSKFQMRSRYSEGLKNFLDNKNEEHLTQAYEMGRKSLRKGISELDVIEFHHDALDRIADFSQQDLDGASTYLKEWLAPYEVKLESYRAVIEELNQKNQKLREEVENRKKVQKELLDSKNYFQLLIENGQDLITVLDQGGTTHYNSPSIERILNYKQHELVGKNAFNYIHEHDVERVKKVFENIAKTPEQIDSAEFRFLHKNGHWVYLEGIAKHVSDHHNGPLIIVNSRDVTERRFTMRKLKEHRAKLAEAQQIARVGSWEWRPGEEPDLEWSDEMCRIFGFSPENFDHSYETFLNHIHSEDRNYVIQHIEEALQMKSRFSFEHRITRLDGAMRILLMKGRPVTNQKQEVIKMIGTGQDVTEQKKREQKLRGYSEQLRNLTKKMERAREEERSRISREIHDELGQMLTVLKMDISMLSNQMKKKVSSEILNFFNGEAGKVLQRINTIIESVQRITTDLRPEVLDDVGLKEAIEWQANEFESSSGIRVKFRTNVEKTDFLDDIQSTAIFRILQETLTNIMRHSEASEVFVNFKRAETDIYLIVKDNGKGITDGQKIASSSFGLLGMRERAQFLGGELHIEGEKGEGTTVSLRVPLIHKKMSNFKGETE